MSRKSQRRHKSQSLIAAGKINPIAWDISKSEAAKALQNFGVPVVEVKTVRCLKHQVCISYWDIDGDVCSSFFSYRIFERWYEAVESAIATCETLEDCDRIGDSIQYELVKFSYPVGLGNRMWEVWKSRWRELKEAVTIAP